MVRLRTLAFTLAVLAIPAAAQAKKPLSAALLTPALKPTTVLRLDLPPLPANACKVCGSGIPDARIGRNLLLGADGVHDRLRVYVRQDFRQFSVDVGRNSGLVG